jgi:hypothetical protein
MAQNNFRESVIGTGLYYAQSGHDSNDGTSPNEPKKSLTSAFAGGNALSIIGAGNWITTGLSTSVTSGEQRAAADGIVVIDLQGNSLSNRLKLNGFTIKNFTWNSTNSAALQTTRNNSEFIAGTGSLGSLTTNVHTFENTKLLECEVLVSLNSNRFKCVFKGCIIDKISSASQVIQGQNFINTYVGSGKVIQMDFATSGAVPSITDTISTANNILCNCNINGLIRLPITGGSGWQDYAIQDQLTGTPQDNGYDSSVHWLNETNLTTDGFVGTVSGWNAVVDTLINRPPRFINPPGYNYNLLADSPHIKTGFGGSVNIGSTNVGETILVTDGGVGTTQVYLSPEIDDSVPSELKLLTDEIEGYVDIIKYVPRVIQFLRPNTIFAFNSDEAGGTATNNNVIDSEPLSNDYAKLRTTVAASGSTTQFILDNAENIIIGDWSRIAGQVREVTNVEANTPVAGQKRVTVASAFRTTIGSGIEVTYGTEEQLAVLTPNRLTCLIRTSNNTLTNPPDIGTPSDWDNNVDPGYGVIGDFLNQEWYTQPGLYIIGGVVYGAGDSNRPSGGSLQGIGGGMWVHFRVVFRNDFNHKGK